MYEQNTSMMNIPEQNAFLLPAMVEGDFSSEEIAEDAAHTPYLLSLITI